MKYYKTARLNNSKIYPLTFQMRSTGIDLFFLCPRR